MNHYPITVVDNFYENPDEVRAFALAQEFKFCHEMKDITYTFPGSRTEDLSIINPDLFQKSCHKLTSIFHNYEHDVMRWSITSCFQSVTEEFGSGVIHHDANTVFAAVLYLTPNPTKSSGTTLYKEGLSFDSKIYHDALIKNDQRFRNKEAINQDYHQMFDEIVTVQNVYNSLIFYEGHHHHAANHFFGKDSLTSRLVQVFFAQRVDSAKENSFPILRSKKIII